MPGEITITATIVSFVLIAIVISGFIFLAHATIALQNSLFDSVKDMYRTEKQALYIASAVRINSTSLVLNLTVKGAPIVPLTRSEAIVKYVDNETSKTIVQLLEYGSNPGWSIKGIYEGSTLRDISTGDYLYPGEIAELIIDLPTNASQKYPIVVTFVSNIGASTTYLLGGD